MNKNDIKILLVDDEPDILEIVGYNLKNEGYQVFTASNGQEAIKSAKKNIPHLILLDIMMPEMDGIEACEKIRKIKYDSHDYTFTDPYMLKAYENKFFVEANYDKMKENIEQKKEHIIKLRQSICDALAYEEQFYEICSSCELFFCTETQDGKWNDIGYYCELCVEKYPDLEFYTDEDFED